MHQFELPYQPDFKPLSEEFGEYRLSDGTTLKARVFLADLFQIGRDAVGPQYALSTVAAFRFIVPEKIRKQIVDKPAVDHVNPNDPGWEYLDVIESKPAESKYLIEDKYLLTLKLEIAGVARNTNYRTPVFIPHYQIRWTTVARIEPKRK